MCSERRKEGRKERIKGNQGEKEMFSSLEAASIMKREMKQTHLHHLSQLLR